MYTELLKQKSNKENNELRKVTNFRKIKKSIKMVQFSRALGIQKKTMFTLIYFICLYFKILSGL